VGVASIRRTEEPITGSRGNLLFRREWSPPQPDRVLLLVHGLADHGGRYDHLGAWFAARGCTVHAYDQQGHGRSTGSPGHLRRFSDLLDDLDVVLQFVQARHPGLPVFLVGHSMGGLVVASFARERHPEVAGVVTSGAALRIGGISRARILAVRILSRLLPRLRFDAEIDAAGLSRDLEVVSDYRNDPLVFRRITLSFARELFAAVERVAGGATGVQLPMLLLHGEADPICPVGASRDFFDQLTAAGRRLETYPGLLHEIFNEPERLTVFDDLLGWVRGQEGRA
jgi:alpha-beta hydrolase superfamily lysophospholipase